MPAAFALSGMASADIQVPLRVLNSTCDASRPFPPRWERATLLARQPRTGFSAVRRDMWFRGSQALRLNKKYSILAGVKYQY
ncbi:MAG: hypothetical protein ACLT8E_02865 [Akkermansia sp.]